MFNTTMPIIILDRPKSTFFLTLAHTMTMFKVRDAVKELIAEDDELTPRS